MKAVLLSAGYGTRLMPLTSKLPKCLVPIHKIPLLHIWITRLLQHGVTEIIINSHYKSEMVREFIKNQSYVKKIHIVYEDLLLGTAGTILSLSSELNKENFFVFHSDNISFIDFDNFLKSHLDRDIGCIASMAAFETDSPSTCGIIEMNEKNVLTSFVEKPEKSTLKRANSASFIFQPDIFIELQAIAEMKNSALDISLDLIPRLIGKMNVYEFSEYHRDIGNLASLEKAHADIPSTELLRKLKGNTDERT